MPARGTTVTLLLPYASTPSMLAPELDSESSTQTPSSAHATSSAT
jgi:hypothetical protein